MKAITWTNCFECVPIQNDESISQTVYKSMTEKSSFLRVSAILLGYGWTILYTDPRWTSIVCNVFTSD
jgi:hypothetical protein